MFLGLSSLTVTILKTEGVTLDFIGGLRAAFLAGAAVWSLWLGWRVAGQYAGGLASRALALAAVAVAIAIGCFVWASLFWKF